MARIEGTRMKHGKPRATATGRPQRKAREGQVRSPAVTERPIVARKPGNAGGVKGPQFKDQRTQEQGTA
jgi:hypothetical protein